METHFQDRIENGLFMIEKERRRVSRNQRKREIGCDTDDAVWDESDLFTVEGCCYALALYLLKQRPRPVN